MLESTNGDKARSRQSSPLLAYVFRRLGAGLATLLAATFLIFVAVQILPGNAAQVALGINGSPERVRELSEALHLNDPFTDRYFRFLGGFATGDLGLSTAAAASGRNVAVSEAILHPLVNSLTLAMVSLLLIVPTALVLGILAAYWKGSVFDHVVSTLSIILTSMPEFLSATLLVMVFFDILDVLPPISLFDSASWAILNLRQLILPALTLAMVSVGVTVRLIRAETSDVMTRNYVMVPRINRVPESRVAASYILRNSLAPSVQALGMTAQYLIGGIVIVESVYNYPGIGALLLNAVQTRDVQIITVVSTILAGLYILINILTDVLVMLLTPRLRAAS